MLYEVIGQEREKATLWRLFSMLPLLDNLLNDHIFRWFAVNIPMRLVEGDREGEIDIIAKLKYPPRSRDTWFFRTWEAKAALVLADGRAKSLKGGEGKKKGVLTQLDNYRAFGANSVSLLDLYICEEGVIDNCGFPTPEVAKAIEGKRGMLDGKGYGYQILPFEHFKLNGRDFGLRIPSGPAQNTMLNQQAEIAGGRFAELVEKLDTFFESVGDRPRKSRHQIVYCEKCKSLQLILMRNEINCPSCRVNAS